MNTSYKHKKRLREEPCHESKQKDKEDRQCSKVAKKDPPFEENRSNHQEPNMNEPSFPYPVDDDDHCETPIDAYRHIVPVLEEIAKKLGKNWMDLKVYDPYFCTGSALKRMNEVGIKDVYNRKEDFYAKMASGSLPAFDVLITNPPYSMDHMDKICSFARSISQPSLLLMPNYVYLKEYFRHQPNMFYVAPFQRYLYTTPMGRRQQKSSKYTSPFPTFWYGCTGKGDVSIKSLLSLRNNEVYIASKASQLPVVCLPDNDPRKKKDKNAKKRKKNKERKAARKHDA